MVRPTSEFTSQHEPPSEYHLNSSNVAGIIQGKLDTPLNDHGRYEASLVSSRLSSLDTTEIWSSPLSRAKETAEIIAKPHSIHVQTNPGLMERGLGSLEGRRRLRGEPLPSDIERNDVYVNHDLL
jgi:probable phosphoglycerate mutase